MEGKIKIFGEVIYDQIEEASLWGCVNLIAIDKQIEKQPNATSFEVEINTIGGSVSEGLAIYARLRELSAQGKPITTRIKGQCASIGTVIFLAGDTRKVNELFEPFVHEVQGGVQGSNTDIQDYARMMQQTNGKIINHYDAHLKISVEEITEMMQKEEYITPEKALEIGFATEIEEILRPQAKLNIINKHKRMKNDEFSKEDKGVITRFLNSLGFKKEPKNIIVKTADQRDLDFYELESGEPVKGDKARIDGANASGEILLANGDTAVFTDGGVLDEIRKKEDSNEELENLKNEVDSLKEQLQNSKTELENRVTDFTGLEEKYKNLETKHSDLTNKLQNAYSNVVVDTTNKNPKPETQTKLSLAERMERMANNK